MRAHTNLGTLREQLVRAHANLGTLGGGGGATCEGSYEPWNPAAGGGEQLVRGVLEHVIRDSS